MLTIGFSPIIGCVFLVIELFVSFTVTEQIFVMDINLFFMNFGDVIILIVQSNS